MKPPCTERYARWCERTGANHSLLLDLLSWSHYAVLLQVKDKEARDWYEKEAAEQTWSVRTLQRNISSQYYYRMLKTQKAMFYLQQQETEL